MSRLPIDQELHESTAVSGKSTSQFCSGVSRSRCFMLNQRLGNAGSNAVSFSLVGTFVGRTVDHDFGCNPVGRASVVFYFQRRLTMSTDSAELVVDEPSDKPPRNPVERVIVWGLIGVLLVVMGIEARAQRGYAMSLDAFQTTFSDGEEVEITLDDARKLMALGPAEVKAPDEYGPYHFYDYYRFSWFSLFKSGDYEITLKVTDNDELTVISFSTPAAPQPAWMEMDESSLPPEEAASFDPATMGGGGFSGDDGFGGDGSSGRGSGDRGFRPPPNPLVTKLDVDGDNELSAEEIAGSPAVLKSLDANGDGELTADEFDPEGLGRRREGFESGSFTPGGGGELGSGSDIPRRPEIEE